MPWLVHHVLVQIFLAFKILLFITPKVEKQGIDDLVALSHILYAMSSAAESEATMGPHCRESLAGEVNIRLSWQTQSNYTARVGKNHTLIPQHNGLVWQVNQGN